MNKYKGSILASSSVIYGSFLRGTPITKIDGQKVRIEDIQRGDLLCGIGPNGESNTSQVMIIAKDYCDNYLRITTEDTELNVVGKHRLYVGPDVPSDNECPHFVKADTLKVNDSLYFRKDNEVKKTKIVDIIEVNERTEVFNLKCERPGVAATHDDEDCWATFHAAGIAAHEMGACAPIGITHIIPNCGPPGTLVTIIARNDNTVHAYEGFDGFFGDGVCGCATGCNPGYVTGVTFSGNPATVLGSSRFICHAIAPQGSGTATISATTDWGGFTTAFASGTNQFTYSDLCGYGWGPSYPHQKHSTGPTSKTVPHNKPINQWTTTKGVGMRRKQFAVPPAPPPPPPPPFGEGGDFHQRHDTGQTTFALSHDTPLNEWTTTKGIGMRRKWILSSTAFAAVQTLTSQNAVEVFGVGDPSIRTTQNGVEVLGNSNPDIRTTQIAIEVIGNSNPDIRTTQIAIEVIGNSNPDIRTTQIAIEVIGPVAEPPPGPIFGYRGNIHQRHDTGQTNHSISHELPLNQWTSGKGIGLNRQTMRAAAELPPPPPNISCYNTSTLEFIAENAEWIVPPNVYQVKIECWGAGQSGGFCTPGGQGGSYATSIVSVLPGQLYYITSRNRHETDTSQVQDSSFNTIVAAGSLYPADSVGDYIIDGLPGTPEYTVYIPFDRYLTNGGNGGHAGNGGAGGAGGAPGAVINEGNDGEPGEFPGGGGGSAGFTTEYVSPFAPPLIFGDEPSPTGGDGADGLVRLTFCTPFGYLGNYHRRHDTGPTANSIPHNAPLNQYTTTQGIGLRRRVMLAASFEPEPPPFVLPTMINIRACNCAEYLPPES